MKGTLAKPLRAHPDADASAPGTKLREVARAATDELGLTAPANQGPQQRLTSQEIFQLIQQSAYYKAEARGFSPGYEERDWLEAEAELKARLGVGRAG